MSTALLDALALYLAGRGVASYDPSGAVPAGAWPTFIDQLPSSPDQVIALFTYRSTAPDPRLPFDFTRVQVRIRGTRDPLMSRGKGDEVYSALHGLTRTTLPGGVWVQDIEAMQAGPESIGADASERHEHVVNLDVDWLNPTDHRPAL